jgi:hypothetical protein
MPRVLPHEDPTASANLEAKKRFSAGLSFKIFLQLQEHVCGIVPCQNHSELGCKKNVFNKKKNISNGPIPQPAPPTENTIF